MGTGKATRYKFPDIRPFVSFEMGQFSRDLMVIAFLGGHIAFHPVQCVRPIYQSSSLSWVELSRIRVAVRGGRVRAPCTYVCACVRGTGRGKGRAWRRGEEGRNRWTERSRSRRYGGTERAASVGTAGTEEREGEERDVDRAVTGNPSATEQQSAWWSCPARLQTGSGRGVAAELNYYKLPRHSYRMHAPARDRKSSPLRQVLDFARRPPPADVIIVGLSAN